MFVLNNSFSMPAFTAVVVTGTLCVVGPCFLFGLALVATIFVRAMPRRSGERRLAGLGNEVRIYHDKHGVPHIFSENFQDAARCLGYLHASERLFQMEIHRRAGQGRLSEIFGADFVDTDKIIRVLGLYQLAKTSFAALAPETQSTLSAYADGVNAFLSTHRSKLPFEMVWLRIRPEPWSPIDSIVWGKLMAWQMSRNYLAELNRAELTSRIGTVDAGPFYPDPMRGKTGPSASGGSGGSRGQSDFSDKMGALLGLANGASNAWVVAGERTTGGHPLLANDPHLDVSSPVLWFLCRIVTPEGWVKGAGVPGVPMILLGQNESIAWGTTAAMSDVQDLFVETLDPADTTKYLAQPGSHAFDRHEETIRVRGRPDVKFAIRKSRHGPVLSDAVPRLAALAGSDGVIALSFSGLGDCDRTAEAFLKLNRARNWEEFKDSLRLYETPAQNMFYADVAGNIGVMSLGRVPVRKSEYGLHPAAGSTGDADWSGYVPFEQMPHSFNPACGYIHNANGRPAWCGHDVFMGCDWEEPYRTQRVQQFFDNIRLHSLETSAEMQADILSLAAQDLLPILLRATPSSPLGRQALALLSKWDGTMHKDWAEPLIFNGWMQALRRMLIDDKAKVKLEYVGPCAASLLRKLILEHPKWCASGEETDLECRACLTRALEEAMAMLSRRRGSDLTKWRWGDEHISTLSHVFYSRIPIFRSLSELGVGSGGDLYTLNSGGALQPHHDRPFERKHVPTFRALYDLGDPDRSRFMTATGQSGHIFSRFYGNLTPLWNEGESITLAGDELALQREGATLMRFIP
ncbi:penicillin acylase family protein [Bradyrhizobium sp. HKCCYLRH1065]|uniref:penicillin acylase family protein n=1 Tax=unclassified Bradyrhizobium TaxID=2631580 RepID=UPI003EBF0487